jgi:hypothetical protein
MPPAPAAALPNFPFAHFWFVFLFKEFEVDMTWIQAATAVLPSKTATFASVMNLQPLRESVLTLLFGVLC